MIGKLNFDQKEATIIGAGISGLLIGYHLKQMGFKIQIHEKSDHVGGLIQTRRTSHGLVECAAHSLLISPSVEKLFNELHIPLRPVRPKSRARFILRHHRLRRMPLNFIEIIVTLFHFFRRRPPINVTEASLKEWCVNYLGTPAHQFLLSPFVSGIFACSPEELNANLTFPKLVPQKSTSLFSHFRSSKKAQAQKGNSPRPQMMVPELGMQSLVDALYENLKSEIHLNSPIASLPASPNVIYTLPTSALSVLIEARDPVSAKLLSSHTYAPLVTVTTFYSREAFRKAPCGVGVLIPREENLRTLGVLFNSSAFENRVNQNDLISLTFMFGGTKDPSALELSDDEIKLLIQKEGALLLGSHSAALSYEITRWPRAIPLYSNSLLQIHESLSKGLCSTRGQIVFSNYSGQVSIRGMIETLSSLHS